MVASRRHRGCVVVVVVAGICIPHASEQASGTERVRSTRALCTASHCTTRERERDRHAMASRERERAERAHAYVRVAASVYAAAAGGRAGRARRAKESLNACPSLSFFGRTRTTFFVVFERCVMQADGEYAGCCGGCFCWLLWSVSLLCFDYLWGRSLTRRFTCPHTLCLCNCAARAVDCQVQHLCALLQHHILQLTVALPIVRSF